MLQVAFDASTDALLILDEQAKVRWANQQAADQLGTGFTILLPGKHFSDLVRLIQADGGSLGDDHPMHPLMRLQGSDGADRYLISRAPTGHPPTASEHRISWRRVTEVPGGFTLITIRDLEPAELALKAQQEFMNQLAHELRTPLAITTGCLQRLSRSLGTRDTGSKELDMAREETRRINHLLEQLSLLNQIDNGTYPWKLEQRTIQSFLDNWTRTLRKDDQRRIHFNLDDLDPYRPVSLDQQAINRALDQLLSNSKRYSPSKSPIVISAAELGTGVELRFMDWGCGIPDDQLETVFQRFHRLEEHRDSHQADGSGLGLTIVRALIDTMGGTARLLPNRTPSGSSGPGTVVQLTLPNPPRAEVDPAQDREPSESKAQSRAEDNLDQICPDDLGSSGLIK